MAFSQVATSASLHFVKISLQFPKLQGETASMGAASTTTQSCAKRDFLKNVRKALDEHGDTSRSRHQFTQELQPLYGQLTTEKIDPC